jgi:hypothetical protein
MMPWKADLESLVEQTEAMIKNANQKRLGSAAKPEASRLPQPIVKPAALNTAPLITAPLNTAALNTAPPNTVRPNAAPPNMTRDSREREDIKLRVAGFKAHQEKLRREREAYYLQMTAKTRAMLRDQDSKGAETD